MGVGLDGSSGLRCVLTGVKCALGWTSTSGRPPSLLYPSLFSCVCWAMADQDKATVFRELYCCSSTALDSWAAPGEIDHQSLGRDKRSIYTHAHPRLCSNSKWGIVEGGLQKKKLNLKIILQIKNIERMVFQTFRKVSIYIKLKTIEMIL